MIDFASREDGCEHPSYGFWGRRYYVGILSVLRRCGMAVVACGLFVALAQSTQAKTAELCGDPSESFEITCSIFNEYCEAFLNDPASLDRATLSPVPARASKWVAPNKLQKQLLGYRRTGNDFISVVYFDDAPSCELLITGARYSQLAFAYQEWRKTEGADYAAVGNFEPRSKKNTSRAFATVFLAGRREDGRVTEITFNWNLSAEGLTRLKVSYQPERQYTAKMLSKGTD